ncbi:MAG TPA: hypothetical protein VHG91_19800, partial [Longimicrobium sp.]|nr:hypothetical protein [Longimicrobium sp.]
PAPAVAFPRHGARGWAFVAATAAGALALALVALLRMLDDDWYPLAGFAAFALSAYALGAIPHVLRFRPAGLRAANVLLGIAGATCVLLPLTGGAGLFPSMLLLAGVLFFADYFRSRAPDFAVDRIAVLEGRATLPHVPRRAARFRQRLAPKRRPAPGTVPRPTESRPWLESVAPPRAFVPGACLAGDDARLLGEVPARANARIAMNNVFAAAGRVSSVTRKALEAALAPYGLSWDGAEEERRSLYGVYVTHFVETHTPEGEREMRALGRLLEVDEGARAAAWR